MKNPWTLVIHDVGTDYVNVWVGTLDENLGQPEQCFVDVFETTNVPEITGQEPKAVPQIVITKDQWERPFTTLPQRFFKLVHISGLSAGKAYEVLFSRTLLPSENEHSSAHKLAFGQFTTLPSELPSSPQKPFVVAIGSCYYNDDDHGKAANAYAHLYHHGSPESRPDVKFFTGDQVYLDIGLDSLSPVLKEVRERIANDYRSSWKLNRKMYRLGANWFLPDDHEYWNNFPFAKGISPYLWMITANKKVRATWKATAKDGIERVQQVSPIRTFNLGHDLSFCVADLRSNRSADKKASRMMQEEDFEALEQWASTLTCPGVLVLPQPLIVQPGGSQDFNLANYKRHYKRLLQALAESGNDIMLLTGDVHYGRLSKVALGNKGSTFYEVISSPLSNLTGIDGKVAASVVEFQTKFPAIDVPNVPKMDVDTDKKWTVSTEKISYWWDIIGKAGYTKTREHFMTLGYIKESGHVKVTINAWRIRTRSGKPQKEFDQPVVFTLKSNT
ncbi:hypothetical protein [Echinimonas agarilytica]|uniref:PhoD-like phosphatase metallophosphatase domain-containing protein n=1 Tax=Echinimonas agarilytica TaxID=1215918 RepID=A0AA41W7Y8_9GAMM|nr:hypothetical protein [Echinimonas agarilytica]MCM2680644.1 hypothetical protein [Echinimonas agarilytica]